MFEQAFDRFLKEQQRQASGQRLEMLRRDMTGTKKLLESTLWPVMKTFDGMTLEYEMTSASGVKIYGDVYVAQLDAVFESEGFVVHAENITRDRFSFERMRVRAMVMYGHKYIPFTWDEMDKKPEMCQRTVFELLGRFGGSSRADDGKRLNANERELLRYAFRLGRPVTLADACACLGLSKVTCAKVLKHLSGKGILEPYRQEKIRVHAYVLRERAK